MVMARKSQTALVHGRRVHIYGPEKGSKKNHGRAQYNWYDPETGKKGSVDAARIIEQKKTGKEVPKGKQVDHKDNNRHNDSPSNLHIMSAHDNIAKGNKHRPKHHRKKK